MPNSSLLPRRADVARPTAGLLPRVALLLFAARPLVAQSPAPPPTLRTATLGACRLSSSTSLGDCRVAYRTSGKLSPSRDNVVVIPTFFAGRSEDHLFMLGAYVDTTRHHVIIIDALADGHSSSPSNSAAGAVAFAGLTIGDMVEVQHRFLTEHLGLRHVRAIVGISMGGFQVFEWAVRYPSFMDAAVPIVATPRPTAYDKLIFDTWRRSAEELSGPRTEPDSAWMQASRLETLFMRTTRFVNDSGDVHTLQGIRGMAKGYKESSWSLADYAAQLRAIASHDISARFSGDMSRAAAATRARLLIVWSPDDMLVDPRPAAAFSRLVGAETLAVPSACGHAVFWCEPERIGRVVREFIDRAPGLASR